MVAGPRSGDIIAQIQRLGGLGITCHTQLVICPEINWGDELERSIEDLAALRPIVESISVVPVGLTKHNNMLKVEDMPAMRPHTISESLDVMARVEALAAPLRRGARLPRPSLRLPLRRVVLQHQNTVPTRAPLRRLRPD